MSDASSLRRAVTLPTATGQNASSIRFNTTTRRPVYSNGTSWHDFRQPKISQLTYTVDATAEMVTKTFFVANQLCRIVSIQEVHRVLATSTAASLTITKDIQGTAAGGGVPLNTTAFNLHSTAATVQAGVLSTNANDLFLQPGDKLSVSFSGTLTALRGVQVTVEVETANQDFDIAAFQNTNTNCATECIFTANEAYQVIGISETHNVAGTVAGATITCTKDTGTNAPGAGTAMLTAAIDLTAAALTPQAGTLAVAPATTVLAAGDRISLKYAGTLTTLAGVVVTITLRPLNKTRCVVNNTQRANGDILTECFYVADKPCVVTSITEVHSTLGTNGSAVNLTVTKETTTGAAGTGTSLLSDNAGAGVDLKGTINTVQVGTLTTTGSALVLAKGDRLSFLTAGVLTAVAGVSVTVTLDTIN